MHECNLKRVIEVCAVFWADAGRANRLSNQPKAIYLYEAQVPNEPNRQTQASATTSVLQDSYAGNNADYVKHFSEYWLPAAHEIDLEIAQVQGFDCWVDAWILLATV
jgi:hypothetical protein